MTLSKLWLTLHILAAIAAFGPTFAYGIIGARGGKDPRHALFATETIEAIANRLTYPIGLVVLVTGILMIFSADISLGDNPWLWIALILYVITYLFSFLVQRPAGLAMIAEMKKMTGPPPEGASGPPPQLARLVKRTQLGGMFLTLMLVVIVVLMVWKPGGVSSIG